MQHARDQMHLVEHHHGWIKSRLDLAVAVLLGLSVMSIAWGAYKAAVKGKDADHYFNRSDETIGTAHKIELQGDQEVATNEQLFLELSRDQVEGKVRAVAYLRRHFLTPDFLKREEGDPTLVEALEESERALLSLHTELSRTTYFPVLTEQQLRLAG